MFANFVVHSESEAAGEEGAGFWSNEEGWTNLGCASKFTFAEKRSFSLPLSRGDDATWMPLAYAYNPSLSSLCEVTVLPVEHLHLYDAIEIQGVREEEGDCEVSNESPHFFSTYAHLKAGGCLCIGDFGSYQKARQHADRLSAEHGWPVLCFVPEPFTHA